LFAKIDDCNLKFIDSKALKRFLQKCGAIVTRKLAVAAIRRMDLDSDARLSKPEFLHSITPLEKFTRNSVDELRHQLATKKRTPPRRPKSSTRPSL
jgi:Ca2+-binding EF-hand superfamily protein